MALTVAQRQQVYRLKHPDRAKNSVRKYRETHKEYFKIYGRTEKEKARISEKGRKLRQEHPEIPKARFMAWYYCPLGKCCEFGGCGSTENLEHAHIDYSNPLEFFTFCRKHHRLIDRLYRRFD
jgi:hypothetical protein